jgi:hypothetical protein
LKVVKTERLLITEFSTLPKYDPSSIKQIKVLTNQHIARKLKNFVLIF